jgi:hypothetical protein
MAYTLPLHHALLIAFASFHLPLLPRVWSSSQLGVGGPLGQQVAYLRTRVEEARQAWFG